MAKCAGCNSKVEPGMVRCSSCGVDLARPGAFLQTLGFVIVAISTVPFALGEVVSSEGNHIPLIAGGAILAVGVVAIVSARNKNRGIAPKVIEDAVVDDSAAR